MKKGKRRPWAARIAFFGGLLGIGWIGDVLGETWLSGNHYLYEAIARRDVAAVRRLLEAGKNPSSRFGGIVETDRVLRDHPPLAEAISSGREEIVVLLAQYGADPNVDAANREPVLHMAIARGMTNAVRVMLEKGADPNRLSRRDNGPALWLMLGGRREPREMKPDIRTLLVAAGAK